jgi:serine phosphatase RsbU (regulator of sigma subunit)
MGQVRTAIRSYALLELPPSELLRYVSQLTGNLGDGSFVTCFYAVHDPVAGTLAPEQIGEALAQPLGVGREFPQRQAEFPPGTGLVLYTDGLVEGRTRDLRLGIERLLAALGGLRAGPGAEAAWDRLVHDLTGGRHDDDIALIHVHHRSGGAA